MLKPLLMSFLLTLPAFSESVPRHVACLQTPHGGLPATQEHYNLQNGWNDLRGPSIRFGNGGNGMVVADEIHPWSLPLWRRFDGNGDGRLNPQEWSRMRVELPIGKELPLDCHFCPVD